MKCTQKLKLYRVKLEEGQLWTCHSALSSEIIAETKINRSLKCKQKNKPLELPCLGREMTLDMDIM
jgi:hypothetical protein